MSLTFAFPSWPVQRFAAWLFVCLLAALLTGCLGDNGDDGGSTAPVGTAPRITTQPASVTVTAPATATFTVVAAGTDPLTYQWRKNGTPIAGANAASYTTPETIAADTGALYTVVVGNAVGSLTSSGATLTVGSAPIAPTPTQQPADQIVTAPTTATFNAAFSGTAPITYQWTRNGVAIAGATATSYTTPATTVAADNNALFAVTATNAGGFATSNGAKLTVNATGSPVSITAQPTPQTVTPDATATFSVTAAGDAPFGYQWFRNGTAIGGATAASYTTAATVAADTGARFKVTVTNPVNSLTSDEVVLTVTTTPAPPPPPVITTQPADANPVVGAAVSFGVVATSSVPMTYQWYRDGTLISGAAASTYTIASVASTDNGARLKVIVSNSTGSTPSREATLSITAQLPVITGPVDTSVVVGQSATFSVTVTGTSPFGYQWKKNNVVIAGATAASYTTPAAVTSDNGATYTVVVTNTAGSVTSAAVKLIVAAVVAPVIDTQPISISVPNGQTGTFNVVAHGTAPLVYQWSKNGTAIPGATAASFTTPVVSFADDQAKYTVVVSNPAPAVATSTAAVLTVTLPITPVVQVAAGFHHSLALRASGAVYSWGPWGNNSANALAGAGDTQFSAGTTIRLRQVDNTPFLGVTAIAAGGSQSVLIRNSDTVWVWGYVQSYGTCVIGDGACQTRSYPTQLKDASGVPFTGAAQVAAGYYYSLALRNDGTLWSWGNNDYGQLGDGSTTQRLNAVQVFGPTGGFLTGVQKIAAGTYHALALKSDGTVYAWGYGANGEIGDGSAATRVSFPKQVEVAAGVPLTDITAIASGDSHSVALKSDGTVYAWGLNAHGAVGDGTTTDRPRATVMRTSSGQPIAGIVAIAAGAEFTVLLKSDGTVLTVGLNDVGQLGDNSTAAYRVNSVPVLDAAGGTFGADPVTAVTSVSAFFKHVAVTRADGSVWAWGSNGWYQLGDTTGVDRRNPVPAPAYVP